MDAEASAHARVCDAMQEAQVQSRDCMRREELTARELRSALQSNSNDQPSAMGELAEQWHGAQVRSAEALAESRAEVLRLRTEVSQSVGSFAHQSGAMRNLECEKERLLKLSLIHI